MEPEAIPLPKPAKDEPLMLHPVVRKLEQEAIDGYRAKYPDAPPWQELSDSTRFMWVDYAEKQRAAAIRSGTAPAQEGCRVCDGTGRFGDGRADGSGRWIECPGCDGGNAKGKS